MARTIPRRRQIQNAFCLLVSGFGLGWLVGLSVSPVVQTVLASLIALVVSLSTALAGLRTGDTQKEDEVSTNSSVNAPPRRNLTWRLPDFLDPLPVMFMVVGLACGASVGVYGRANNWLGARSNIYVEEWKETGLSAKEITTRVFDLLYPPTTSNNETATEGAGNTTQGVDQSANTGQPTPTQSATQPPAKRVNNATSQSGEKRGTEAERPASFRAGVLFSTTLEQCIRLRNAEDEDELRREMASSNEERLVSLARTCKSIECLRAGVNRACAKYK